MEKVNVIKAWKDPEYRASLTPEQLASLPEHPAGVLNKDQLQKIKGVGPNNTISCTPFRGCGEVYSLSAECMRFSCSFL